jgi:hypothetical protein
LFFNVFPEDAPVHRHQHAPVRLVVLTWEGQIFSRLQLEVRIRRDDAGHVQLL